MEKKVIEIYKAPNIDNYIYDGNFMMAFISRVINGKRYQITNKQTCRDYAHEFIRLEIMDRKKELKNREQFASYGYIPTGDKRLDINKLRLLICSNTSSVYDREENLISIDQDELKERIFCAKRIINVYESHLDWPKTKVMKAVCKDDNAKNQKLHCWYVSGPKNWMRNPHLLSLLTITFRLTIRYGTFDFKTLEDIEKGFKSYSFNKNNHYTTDKLIAGELGRHIVKLINRYEEIFKDLNEEELYHINLNGKSLNNFHGSGGILSFFSATTGISELNVRVKSMIRK
jgi:hypothetical protein